MRQWNGKRPTLEQNSKGAKIAWASDPERMRAGAKSGGLKTVSIVRSCPHCAREIRGNSFFRHLKICSNTTDK
jgi:hypothetical protein